MKNFNKNKFITIVLAAIILFLSVSSFIIPKNLPTFDIDSCYVEAHINGNTKTVDIPVNEVKEYLKDLKYVRSFMKDKYDADENEMMLYCVNKDGYYQFFVTDHVYLFIGSSSMYYKITNDTDLMNYLYTVTGIKK